MISPHTTKDLDSLESEIRLARQQALRRAVRQLTLRHLGLCIVLGFVCAMLGGCGGGDPEDDERPCIVEGKTYKPEVCR